MTLMKNVFIILTGGLCALSPTGAVASAEERLVVAGESAAVSPDGRRLAFHRFEDGVLKLGVCPSEGGTVTWIESGPGMAAYPAWAPDGSLVYTYGHETLTAYEAYKSQATGGGYGLRVRQADGRTRELCTGYTRDYLPTVSADGQTVYFTTTREVSVVEGQMLAMSSHIARVPFDGSAKPVVVLRAPGSYSYNTAVAQPSLSPDGRHLVWAQLSSLDEGWALFGARLDEIGRPNRRVLLTPELLTALSPRWHPDGTLVAFTGFRQDDPGYGVWLMDMRAFALRRVCDGENPTFSPDGKWLYYDRERQIYRRPFGLADRPVPGEVTFRKPVGQDVPQSVLWTSGAGAGDVSTIVGNLGPSFAVGSDTVVYLRAKVRWNGEKGLQRFVRGIYGESDQALQLFATATGAVWFSTRDSYNKFVGATQVLPGPGEYDLVGVRTRTCLYLYVNGVSERGFRSGLNLSLDRPVSFEIGVGCPTGTSVRAAEIGTGWPKSLLPGCLTKEEVMK